MAYLNTDHWRTLCSPEDLDLLRAAKAGTGYLRLSAAQVQEAAHTLEMDLRKKLRVEFNKTLTEDQP